MLKLVPFVTGNPIKLPDISGRQQTEAKVGMDEEEASTLIKGCVC